MEAERKGAAAGAGEDQDLGSLERALADERRKNEELLTRLKYLQADLENYRKRADKEMKEAGESLAKTLAGRLIVVQDELDLALKHAKGKADKELMEGITMVRGNLMSALESVGVERIASAGKPFDPAVHEAVEKVYGGSEGKDVVLEEIRPGYTFRGQLLRPTMVKVELASEEPGAEAEANE